MFGVEEPGCCRLNHEARHDNIVRLVDRRNPIAGVAACTAPATIVKLSAYSRQPRQTTAELFQVSPIKSRCIKCHVSGSEIQFNNRSYVHSSGGTSLNLILVGCLLLAGNTFRMYKSPTLIVSYLGLSPSSTQQSRTSRSASGSGVRKNGREYRSCPVLFLTRCTVAWNLPFDCLSRYWPTLQTNVPGLGGASTQMPS